jgi:hypothetical protein
MKQGNSLSKQTNYLDMRKSIFFTLLFLSTFFCQAQSQADFYGGGGFGFGAGGYYGTAPLTPNPVWGGGYNLNSLAGGGWGGYPAGFGMPGGFYGGAPFPAAVIPQSGYSGGCPGGGGALTGGFGGYYSPYIGGY